MVFVSYANESAEATQRVAGLVASLRGRGVDVAWDADVEPAPAEGWPRWCAHGIEEADAVVCVATPTWKRRVQGRETVGVGRGATFEGLLLYQLVFEGNRHGRFFVVIDGEHMAEDAVPLVLRSWRVYRLGSDMDQLADDLAALTVAPVPPGHAAAAPAWPSAVTTAVGLLAAQRKHWSDGGFHPTHHACLATDPAGALRAIRNRLEDLDFLEVNSTGTLQDHRELVKSVRFLYGATQRWFVVSSLDVPPKLQ